MKQIKGILIDPENAVIKEVTFHPQLNEYYRLIGCDCITSYPYDDEHDFVLDDEGLFKELTNGFRLKDDSIESGFVGKAVLVGRGELDWNSHRLNLEDVKNRIQFFVITQTPLGTMLLDKPTQQTEE